jgi:hypothetical protein
LHRSHTLRVAARSGSCDEIRIPANGEPVVPVAVVIFRLFVGKGKREKGKKEGLERNISGVRTFPERASLFLSFSLLLVAWAL